MTIKNPYDKAYTLGRQLPKRITLKNVYACDVKWEDMKGDSERRFCDRCGHDVHNLIGKSEEEVGAIIAKLGPGFCGQFSVRKDGRVALGECELPVPQMRGRLVST